MGISSPLFIGLDTAPAGATSITTLTQSFFNENTQNGFTVAVPQGSEAPSGCADPTTGCDYSSSVLGVDESASDGPATISPSESITYPCLTEAPGSEGTTSGSSLGDCDLPDGTTYNGPVPGADYQDPTATPASDETGTLRLTTDAQYQVGGVFYSTSFPTAEGLDMEFNTYQWTDSLNEHAAGDGIGFVLAAANPTDPQPPSSPGPVGGDLGYSSDWLGYNTAQSGQTCSDAGGDTPQSDDSDTGGSSGCYLQKSTHHEYGADDGIPYGYLGFGLDTYGDYANPAFQGQGCQTTGGISGDSSLGLSIDTASAEYPEAISVKGPGDGTDGYCLLDSTAENYSGLNAQSSLAYHDYADGGTLGTGTTSGTNTLSPGEYCATGTTLPAVCVSNNGTDGSGGPSYLLTQFGATGGTFDLSLDTGSGAQSTTPLSYDASASAVETALDALSAGITVSGGPLPTTETVNFPSSTTVNSFSSDPTDLTPSATAFNSDSLDSVPISLDEGTSDDLTRPAPTQVEVLLNTGTSADPMSLSGCTGNSVAPGYWGICVLPLSFSDTTDASHPVFMTDKLPSDSYAPSNWLDANGVPKQMVFGWTASTGASVEIHEVNHLGVQTTNGTLPLLDVSTEDSEGPNSGDPATTGNFVSQPSGSYGNDSSPTFTITPTLLYSNDVSGADYGGPETQPITLTETFDSHIDLTDAVVTSAEDGADNSWNCSISGQVLTCTIDPSTEPAHEFNPNGANLTLPLITVRGDTVDASSGTLTTTAEISSADGLPASTSESGTAQATTAPTDQVSLSSGTNPTTTGTSVTYTATVTGTGSTPPTGSVTFEDAGTPITSNSNQTVSSCGSNGIVSLTPATSPGADYSTATCTVDYVNTTGSPHPITTPYTGDSNYSSATSNTYDETVNSAAPSPTDVVTLSSGTNATGPGSSVTYTATVTGSGGTAPTGHVTFEDNGTAIVSDWNQTVSGCGTGGIVNLVPGSGSVSTATCTVDYLSTSGSPHPITTPYGGDSNYNTASSNTYDETVLEVFTLTAVAVPSTTSVGNPVVLIGQGIPAAATGTVTFTSGGTQLCSYNIASASYCTTSTTLAAGSYPVTATYSGDSTYLSETATTSFTLTPPSSTSTPSTSVTIVDLSTTTPYEHSVSLTVPVPGTVTITDQPPASEGSCSVNTDGSINFTPATDYSGVAVCDYTVTLDGVTSPPATVTVTVLPAATSTTLKGNTHKTTAALPVPHGTGPFTYKITKQPPASEGTCSINSSETITFVRKTGYSGAAVCDYAVVDGAGNVSDTASVTFTGGSDVVAAQGVTPENTPITLRTKVPTGRGPDTYTILTHPPASDGTGSFASNGAFTFRPADGFTGVVSFTYEVRNGAGQITQGSVTIRVGSSGAVIPGVHTGEAWASPLYWLAMGLVGVLGGSLVLTGRLKRRQT